MTCKIFALPDTEALWLTANRRLVHYWQEIYTNESIQTKKVWISPQILPLKTWLTVLFQQQTFDSRCVLSEWQAWLLWKQAIKTCEYAAWLNSTTLIPLMMEAWDRLHLYGSSLDQCAIGFNDDSEKFVQCARYVEKQCKQNGWITFAEIPAFLIEHFSCVTLQKPIYLLGFIHEMSPAIKRFIECCRSSVPVIFLDVPVQQAKIERFEYQDTRDEIYQMAYWAIKRWQRDKHQRIACLVPQLNQLRPKINTVFEEIFIRLTKGHSHEVPFNISIGKPLLNFALVKTAIHLLCLPNEETIQLNDLLPLLYSAYGLPGELVSSLDLYLRQQDCCAWSSKQLGALLLQHFPDNPLTNYWQSYLDRLKQNYVCYTARIWAEFLMKQLEILQWPFGELPFDQWQVAKRFREALIEFSKTDTIVQPISLSEALMLLKAYLKQVVFQPSQGTSQPIQILGLLEAAGHSFEAIWMMGLDDQTWPAPAKLNPFIPFVLQKQLSMPHTSHAHELMYAQTLKNYVLTHASEVIMSHSYSKEGQTVTASPLIRDVPLQAVIESIRPIEKTIVRPTLELVKKETIESLHESESIKGGCAILKDQAVCPFRAFAHFRLNASALDEPGMGISSLKRGQWVHTALECFWKQIQTQEKLIALTNEELNNAIVDAVAKSRNKVFPLHKMPPAGFFLTLEAGHLEKTLLNWLALEKTRSPFAVISIEAKHSIAVGPLNLNVRMDRLDQLADGSQLVIDYKTGQTKQNHWFENPLREPQLPLYCAFGLGEIHGIAFAELSIRGVQFKGVSAHAMGIPGIQAIDVISTTPHDDWDTLRTYWAKQLIELAHQFYGGHSAVSPIDTQACRYCDLQSLCRIE